MTIDGVVGWRAVLGSSSSGGSAASARTAARRVLQSGWPLAFVACSPARRISMGATWLSQRHLIVARGDRISDNMVCGNQVRAGAVAPGDPGCSEFLAGLNRVHATKNPFRERSEVRVGLSELSFEGVQALCERRVLRLRERQGLLGGPESLRELGDVRTTGAALGTQLRQADNDAGDQEHSEQSQPSERHLLQSRSPA